MAPWRIISGKQLTSAWLAAAYQWRSGRIVAKGI